MGFGGDKSTSREPDTRLVDHMDHKLGKKNSFINIKSMFELNIRIKKTRLFTI